MQVFLEDKDLNDAFVDAEKNARYFFEPFDEYERLASNKLRKDLKSNMPKVNDGSLASLLIEIPMKVLAQQQTGVVKCSDRMEPWVEELAQIMWTDTITKKANTLAPFFVKQQTNLYRALTHGASASFTFFGRRGSYLGADYTLPYIRDIYIEPGKVSDTDSDYVFMVTYYTKLQIQSLIKQGEEEDKLAKFEMRPSMNKWDVSALKKVLNDAQVAKDNDNKTPVERDKSIKDTAYKFITCFHRGISAPFMTFVQGGESKNSSDIMMVRKTENLDPSGELPIQFQYAFQDLMNPYGKGQIELSGGVQNVLDYMTQLQVLATQIGLQPPIKIAGPRDGLKLKSLVYSPRKYWMVGNADVEVMQTANSIYNQFTNAYGLYKTQLMNTMGTSDASVSAEAGNPQYSKTDAGVKYQETRTNAHENFLRQGANSWLNRAATSMLNLHFANMQGSEMVTLVSEQAERLTRAGIAIPPTNEIEVVWDNVRGTYEFDVDPDSSIVKNDEEQVAKLQEVITAAVENPTIVPLLAQSGVQLNIGEAYKALFNRLGLQDVEKIIVPMMPEAGVGGVDPMTGEPIADPALGGQMPPQDPLMTPEMMVPNPQLPTDELQLTMQQYGIAEAEAQAVLDARAQGTPEEDIVAYFAGRGAMNG